MAPVEPTAKVAPDSTEVSVSLDELGMLELFRSMKLATGRRKGRASRSLPRKPATAPFDEAVVIAHRADEGSLQFGFVKITAEAKSAEYIPIHSIAKNDIIELLWNELTIGEEFAVSDREKKPSFMESVSDEFAKSKAIHQRAREVIARYDETSKTSDEISRRTRELLSNNRR